MKADPKFSLVVPTLRRTDEVSRLLSSLCDQSASVQVILVDQNSDDRLHTVVEQFAHSLEVEHLRVQPHGISAARNEGLRFVRGAVVAFPDDDCWYPPRLLANIIEWFEKHDDWDGLSTLVADEDGSVADRRMALTPGPIDRLNVWRRASSVSLFFRRRVIERIGDFDERVGVGAPTPWQAAEDIDYPLRAIEEGFDLYYDPSLVVRHPASYLRFDDAELEKALGYAAGTGFVLGAHDYPLWFRLKFLVRPIGGAIFSLLTFRLSKARYHYRLARGRARGLVGGCSSP